ncbi:P-loop containing nucleoside triphosphate hydrolase protein, partial [Chytriomyces sp. MP71]
METTADEDEFAGVECILDTRTGTDGVIEYLVKWEGNTSEAAWVPEDDVVGLDSLIAEFNKPKSTQSLEGGENSESGQGHSGQQGAKRNADGVERERGSADKPRKKPVKVAAKQVVRNGKVVYSVLWDDKSLSEESANSIRGNALESLIEEYEIAETSGSTGTRSTRSSQSLAPTTTRSAVLRNSRPAAIEIESVQTTRRTSSRNAGIKLDLIDEAAPEPAISSTRSGKKIGKGSESADAAQMRKRKNVIEDSDEEFNENEDDSEDEEEVDELALGNEVDDDDGYREGRRKIHDKREKGDEGMDLDEEEEEEEASDIESEDAEEEEEEGDTDGEVDDESTGRDLDSRNNGLKTHHDFCLRCGAGDENKPKKGRAKKDADLIGSVGELLPCATCSASCHEKCRIKPNKKDRERYSARAQELGFFIDVYQCPDCFPLTLPPCNICNLPVMHAEGAEAPGPAAAQADPAAGVADAPAPAPVLAQQARILGTEDVTPLFRCSRCKLPAHLSCLVKTYPAAAYKAIDEQPSSRRVLASPEFYTGHWTCFECWKWPKTVDAILTFRDLPLAATAGELQADGQRNSVTREYYVKFLGVSHRWNEWVPARWVEGQRESQGKLGVFLRERVNAWQSFTAGVVVQPGGAKAKPVIAAVNPDFLRVERVLDVQVKRSKHNGVDGKRVEEIKRLDLDKDIESVYVKWLGLPYDASTWELVPVSGLPPEGLDGDKVYKLKVDAEMYPSFVEAFDEYKKRNMIGSIGEEKPCTRDPNFYEFETQPDFIVGGSLKDYQIDGLNWLVYQWFNTQGCILADEMGLGKTLQIVSFLSTLYTGNNYFPFLILAPSITIGHWLDEFHKWAPNMVVVHYTGSKTDRQMIREYEIFRPKSSSSTLRYRFHVLLSSYESMMQESQLFKEIPFAVLVCDEGHRLKNDESRTFRQLMNNITVQHKVVLSGTPLQNNMREMFNLLNFLDPEQYSDPKDLASKFGIENIKSDDTIIPKIHKFLRPLFLRRTKKEVLTFLPPKAEILVPCPLTPVQRELYKAVLAKNFDLLRSIGVQSGQTETKAVPLKNILMELRKICNHPYLGSSNLEPPDTSAADLHKLMVDASGKFSLLQPMLRKLHTRGHRVLIFSQFKIVLDIVEDFLNGENYEYLRIDGETPTSQRHSMINSFNSPDSKHFVFLLTTRTGGTGINLTSADTVIIYDSDWNPHQDIQAVARVHRIGQTKPVLIYKLFTRDTVESSIIERSTSKLVLDKIVVGALDEENVDTKQLSSILKVGARKLFDESTDQESSALKFDDAAVERLIDRDRIIEEEQEKEKAIAVAQAASKNTEDEAGAEARENATKSSFSFAKVWILDAEAAAAEKAKEDDVMETEEQGEDESDENFWERLLQGRIETAVQNFDDSMILGKRRRVAVNYREARRNRPDIQLELEADDASDEYAPEDDSAQESASDASEMEDDALEFKGLSSNAETQWVPWKTFTNRLDPFKARPYLPSESQRIAKCWLCLKQSCRYREHCEKAADAV